MAIVKRDFINPLWENDKKERILCTIEVTHDDDTVKRHQAVIANPNGDNPDWDTVMEKYGQEYLDKILEDAKAENKKRRKKNETERQRHEERQKQEALFARKLEIFEIDEIRDSKDRAAKGAIRKSKTETEAILRGAMLMLKEQENQDKNE